VCTPARPPVAGAAAGSGTARVGKPNIADLLYDRKIDFIINIPATSTIEKYVGMLYDEYQIRRKAVEMGIPVLTTIEAASSFTKTLQWLSSNTPTFAPLRNYVKLE
jgi:carbamoyl-phosphate synthase large subunit